MDRNKRKILYGTVVGNSNNKTILVSVESYKKHPLYAKRFKVHKKYQAHDENNLAKIGDKVTLTETRPYSKKKTFRLVKIKNTTTGGAK